MTTSRMAALVGRDEAKKWKDRGLRGYARMGQFIALPAEQSHILRTTPIKR
jgi:hypothetical protein